MRSKLVFRGKDKREYKIISTINCIEFVVLFVYKAINYMEINLKIKVFFIVIIEFNILFIIRTYRRKRWICECLASDEWLSGSQTSVLRRILFALFLIAVVLQSICVTIFVWIQPFIRLFYYCSPNNKVLEYFKTYFITFFGIKYSMY